MVTAKYQKLPTTKITGDFFLISHLTLLLLLFMQILFILFSIEILRRVKVLEYSLFLTIIGLWEKRQ